MLLPAEKSDWPQIQALSVAIHDLHVAWRPDIYCHSHEPYPRECFLEDVADELVYVAKDGDRIIGYAVLAVFQKQGPGNVPRRKQCRVESIFLEEAFRGQGLGKAMMADIRRIATEKGCTEVCLSVYPENENALGFYRSCGFSVRSINLELK